MVTLRNLDQDRKKSLYPKKVGYHLKVRVVTTALKKSPWLPCASGFLKSKDGKQGDPREVVGVTQVSSHRNVTGTAVCSLKACTEGGHETPQEFQGEVFLNFSYHLGLGILNTEVRPQGCLFT